MGLELVRPVVTTITNSAETAIVAPVPARSATLYMKTASIGWKWRSIKADGTKSDWVVMGATAIQQFPSGLPSQSRGQFARIPSGETLCEVRIDTGGTSAEIYVLWDPANV